MPQPWPHETINVPASCSKHTMDPLHPSFTPYPSLLQSASGLNPKPLSPSLSLYLSLSLSLCLSPHPAPMPTTSRRIQCNPSNDLVLLYPVYVYYIVILFVSLNDDVTIKARRFTCFWKESRVTLSFVVKSKLVTILLLFLFTFLQLPLAASPILGLNNYYARSDSRVKCEILHITQEEQCFRNILPLGGG